MVFGNWKITDSSIVWNGNGLNRFEIPRDEFTRIKSNRTGDALAYEWILLATDKDWLTQNDLYDLNFAFVYAIAKFGIEFNYDTFDATLAEQYEIFEEEDEEDVQL